MPFQSVPDTVEVVPQFFINQQEVTMTFYGKFAAGYDQAAVDDMAEQMDAWVTAEALPVMCTAVIYAQSTARGLESPIDLIAFNNTGAGFGTVGSNPLPNHTCIAVKRASGLTGRSARGRVFFPLYNGALDANENFITNTVAVNIAAALNEVRTYLALAGATEVIVSRYTAGLLRTVGVTFAVTEYSITDLEVDSQKRRMPSR